MEIKRMPRSQFLKLTMENNNLKKYRVNAAPRKLTIKIEYKCNKVSSLLCSQNLIIIKEMSVVKLSAVWKQNFAASCLEKKHKQTRDCLLDIMYM